MLVACADFVRRRKWLQQAVNANTMHGLDAFERLLHVQILSAGESGYSRLPMPTQSTGKSLVPQRPLPGWRRWPGGVGNG
jgi:hypothetical protein